MTTNAGELTTLFIGPIIGLPLALLPIHILWINLISDGLPAISLSFEKAEEQIMSRPPRPPLESVFANGRGRHIIWVGLLMAGIALATQFIAIKYQMHWQTIVFNVLCLSQLGHVLAIRSENKSVFSNGFLSNKPLIAAVLISVMLQGLITYSPIFNPIFKTESLTFVEILFVIGSSTLVLIAVEIEKAIRRKRLCKS